MLLYFFHDSHTILLYTFKRICRKIVEREDELFIVQNIVKSLEVSEEKVIILYELCIVYKF